MPHALRISDYYRFLYPMPTRSTSPTSIYLFVGALPRTPICRRSTPHAHIKSASVRRRVISSTSRIQHPENPQTENPTWPFTNVQPPMERRRWSYVAASSRHIYKYKMLVNKHHTAVLNLAIESIDTWNVLCDAACTPEVKSPRPTLPCRSMANMEAEVPRVRVPVPFVLFQHILDFGHLGPGFALLSPETWCSVCRNSHGAPK